MRLLNINTDPEIRVYQHHAYTLGIILQEEKNYFWLYNNYIQLIYSREGGNGTFNFNMVFAPYQPVLIRNRLDEKLLNSLNIDRLEYITIAINEGKYVYATVDEYYIPNRIFYQKQHYQHDIMILGVDESKKTFTVIGYDDKKQYSTREISEVSLRNSNPQNIELLELNNKYKFRLDIPFIVVQIGQYLNVLPNYVLGDQYFEDTKFGVEACYQLLKTYEKSLDELERCEVNQVYLLMEHKKCMYMRMKYIFEIFELNESKLLEDYDKVIKAANVLVDLVLKYNMCLNPKIVPRIKNLFLDIIEKDQVIITILYNILNKIE